MAEILVTKPGALSRYDKAALRKSGVVVVETDNLASVKLLSTDRGELSASDMLYAALCGVNAHDWGRQAFAKACLDLIKAQRTPSPTVSA